MSDHPQNVIKRVLTDSWQTRKQIHQQTPELSTGQMSTHLRALRERNEVDLLVHGQTHQYRRKESV